MIGVLALQGGFAAHGRALDRLGRPWRRVTRADQLDGLVGLILPGGESTTMEMLMRESGLDQALRDFVQRGGACLGTCAGAILLSSGFLGLLEIDLERNAYGRQLDSVVLDGRVYIRAPRITRVGAGVEVLARRDGDPVLVRQGAQLAATFHPELSEDLTLHRMFCTG